MSESVVTQYEEVNQDKYQLKFAGFWTRFWAYFIDLIVLSAIGGIFIKPLFRVMGIEISNPFFWIFSVYKLTALLLLLVYFAFMTKFFKQTVGKMIMGIKVIPKDQKELTWSTVLFREVIGRFISKMLWIPYLLVIFMPKKEALHDLFADTLVVHEDVYERKTLPNVSMPVDHPIKDA
ncbi:hypothetical protein AU377_00995 [Sporosarcina sp. HYO08]|nr:hypothetical protein AU377_00995 [Sporosarcina sp. HYO08]